MVRANMPACIRPHYRYRAAACVIVALLCEAHGFQTVLPQQARTTQRNHGDDRRSFRLGSSRPQRPRQPYRRSPSSSPNAGDETRIRKRTSHSPGNSNRNNNYDQVRFNKQIVECTDANEVLRLLQSAPLGRPACGGALSSVNFSTALHRLARHCMQQQQQQQSSGGHQKHRQQGIMTNNSSNNNLRATTLTDPRFALFLASLAEALVPSNDDQQQPQKRPAFQFNSRELANIGWALAKLRIAPPQTALAVNLEASSNQEALLADAQQVREKVMEAVKQRQQQQGASTTMTMAQAAWILPLSRLAGHLVDYIGIYLLITEQSDDNHGRRPFQMQEYANLLWSFATTGRATSQVCCLVLTSMMQRQRQALLQHHENSDTAAAAALLEPQEWSNSIWSLATAQMDAASDMVGDVMEYLSVLLDEYPDFYKRFKPQEWSNTVWGIATLLSNHHKVRDGGLTPQEETAALSILRVAARTILDDDQRILAGMKSQELTNTIWGFSTLGFGLPTSSIQNNVNNYIVLSSRSPNEDAKLMHELAIRIASFALPILHKFRSQELNNLAWSLARPVEDASIAPFPELLERISREIGNPRRKVVTQDIGTTLWSMATIKFFDPRLYRGILTRLTPQMITESKPQELSNILWAVATAEMEVDDVDAFDTSLVAKRPKVTDHVTLVYGLVGQEMMRRPEQFKPQEIKDVLWSFSRVGIRFPSLFKRMAEYLVGGVETDSSNFDGRGIMDFSTQGLANLVWAFARQAQLAEDVPARQAGSRLASGNGRLVVFTASHLDIGEKLLQKLFKEVADTSLESYDNLRRLKPQDLCLTAWAFAVLGLKHSRFIETARNEVERRLYENIAGQKTAMNTFKGQELANFLWSIGTVNAESGDLLNALTGYLTTTDVRLVTPSSIAGIFFRQELANIAWSCAVFWKFPKSLMRLLYEGLIGLGENQDPSVLIDAHGDAGLQRQAIMTLVYVQMAMCLDDPTGVDGLSLPHDFPEGWQEPSPSKSFDHTTDSILELKLSTSKIQRAVSAGLHRVGLAHVEEHVITMHDLRHDYGVDVPDSAYEVLSIDIANIEDRIAIEVDGPAHYINEVEFGNDVAAGSLKAAIGKVEYQYLWTGDRQTMNGSTILKHRLLTHLGWKVINVPFWEWHKLENNEAAEDAYCRKILSLAP